MRERGREWEGDKWIKGKGVRERVGKGGRERERERGRGRGRN